MRTTLNLPDPLIREAKLLAVQEGSTLTEVLVQGLRDRLRNQREPRNLPVSESSGGLVDGLDWKNLNGNDDGDHR